MKLKNKQDSESMREYNRSLVLDNIRKGKLTTRASLAKDIGMSSTSIGRIVSALMEEELVVETGSCQNGLGRRATTLELNPNGFFAVGVDIDVHEASVGIVDPFGQTRAKTIVSLDADKTIEEKLLLLARETNLFIRRQPADVTQKILGIGISVSGHVQWTTGTVLLSPQLSLRNFELKQVFEANTNFPVMVDNDVNAYALAERLFGVAKEETDFIVSSIGYGLGFGVFLNGEVVRGRDNVVGELGHIVIDPHGQRCDCGKRGCLQTYICIASLEEREQRPFSAILENAAGGNAHDAGVLEQVRTYGAMWIANLISMYNVPLVILTGRMVKMWPAFADYLQEHYNDYVWEHLKNGLRIEVVGQGDPESTLYVNTPILSGAAIVFNRFYYQHLQQEE